MKAKLIAVSLVLAARAFATNVDLGPNGTYFNKVYGFDGLTGTVMQGQSVTLDLNFNTSVHLFQGTHSDFMIDLSFLASTSNPGFIFGNGCILDGAGLPMDAIAPLGSAHSDQGELFVGLFPIARPLDFYGAHFELTLPDNGLTITDGLLQLFASDYTNKGNPPQGFRFGPHVPDTGATSLMLTLAFLSLLLGRVKWGT